MGTREIDSDGLTVHYGPRITDQFGYSKAPRAAGSTQEMVMTIIGTELTTTVAGHLGGATPDLLNSTISAGSHIVKATLIVDEAFTSGGAPTLDLGTFKTDSAVIDVNGIDAAIALGALTLDAVIVSDGAQINTVVNNTAPAGSVNDAILLGAVGNVAAYTAGKARLIVEYVQGTA